MMKARVFTSFLCTYLPFAKQVFHSRYDGRKLMQTQATIFFFHNRIKGKITVFMKFITDFSVAYEVLCTFIVEYAYYLH